MKILLLIIDNLKLPPEIINNRDIHKVKIFNFDTGIGKGSINIKVASKEIYEYLKLKKYMTMAKYLMQDVLHN